MACKDCKAGDARLTHGSESVCQDCYRERRHGDLVKLLDATELPVTRMDADQWER